MTFDVVTNPATGEYGVLRQAAVSSEGRTVADLYALPGAAVVGEHVHPRSNETFTVVRGVAGLIAGNAAVDTDQVRAICAGFEESGVEEIIFNPATGDLEEIKRLAECLGQVPPPSPTRGGPCSCADGVVIEPEHVLGVVLLLHRDETVIEVGAVDVPQFFRGTTLVRGEEVDHRPGVRPRREGLDAPGQIALHERGLVGTTLYVDGGENGI
ncbi:hypothetical protein Kisp02_46850 [Kineosporia sp. NBRC 101731]|nr:hypothetical protein Kisp02_46850 [Kineosporia sp. NBRC 101731]